MSLHATWAACAGSIARCIAATTPRLADAMFGGSREAGAFAQSGWFRLHTPEVAGFVFVAPNGGDHRYQAAAPDGVDSAALSPAPKVPHGRLSAEADAFLRDARSLAGGSAIAINGGRIPIPATDEAVAAAAGVVAMLEGATALFDPGAVAGLLRSIALGFLRDLPRDGPAALAASTAASATRRAAHGSHGPVWALAQLRATAGATLVTQSPPPALLYRLFDPFGPRADPAHALRLAIVDLAANGQGPMLHDMLGALLARAEAARDRALDSRSVVAHGSALYAAAGDAWTALSLAESLAETLRDAVEPAHWPGMFRPADLERHAASARDIAIRATHALVVDAINLGSGTALLRHQAAIVAEGPAKADELTEARWFYPRALRDTLITPIG